MTCKTSTTTLPFPAKGTALEPAAGANPWTSLPDERGRLRALSPTGRVVCSLFQSGRIGREGVMASRTVSVNRAPVLTLWAAVVAQRLGFDRDEALTLGRAVAGLNAQSKGRRLGIFEPPDEEAKRARQKEQGERFLVEVCGRSVPARNTPAGV